MVWMKTREVQGGSVADWPSPCKHIAVIPRWSRAEHPWGVSWWHLFYTEGMKLVSSIKTKSEDFKKKKKIRGVIALKPWPESSVSSLCRQETRCFDNKVCIGSIYKCLSGKPCNLRGREPEKQWEGICVNNRAKRCVRWKELLDVWGKQLFSFLSMGRWANW